MLKNTVNDNLEYGAIGVKSISWICALSDMVGTDRQVFRGQFVEHFEDRLKVARLQLQQSGLCETASFDVCGRYLRLVLPSTAVRVEVVAAQLRIHRALRYLNIWDDWPDGLGSDRGGTESG